MANDMAIKVFVDANVLIDLALRREQYPAARELFNYILEGTLDGFISPSIVHLVAYWIKKSDRIENVKPFLKMLCNHIHVVDVGHEIAINALKSDMKDVEDALQYYAALAHDVEIFISNDKKLRKLAMPSLPVIKVSDFLLTLQVLTPTTSTHS